MQDEQPPGEPAIIGMMETGTAFFGDETRAKIALRLERLGEAGD